MQKHTRTLPTELRTAQHDIDRWRAGSERRRRIPEPFWQRATELAQHHSVHRVAEAMGLSHKGLKARVELNNALLEPSPPRFVELATSSLPAVSATTGTGLTLRLHDGTARRMEILGADMHGAAGVVCAFFGRGAR